MKIKCLLLFTLTLTLLANDVLAQQSAGSPAGAGNRNAGRIRSLMARDHAVVSYRAQASQRQIEVAQRNIERAQRDYQRKAGASAAQVAARQNTGSRTTSSVNNNATSSYTASAQTTQSSTGATTVAAAATSTSSSVATTVSNTRSSMFEKPNEENLSHIVAVETVSEDPEAKAAVMVANLATGELVDEGVLELSQVPKPGMNVTEHVEEALREGAITENPSEFLENEVVVAGL